MEERLEIRQLRNQIRWKQIEVDKLRREKDQHDGVMTIKGKLIYRAKNDYEQAKRDLVILQSRLDRLLDE
jgi:hypothetical protein